jgi:hypothetical protein
MRHIPSRSRTRWSASPLLGALALLAALAACSSDETVAPAAPSLAASGPQERVTGSAHVLLAGFGNAEEKYSNSIIRHADGSVSGEFELKTEQANGGRLHGTVLCFTVAGNRARVGGVIDQSSTPLASVGTHVLWTIVDNGEGANDPPDQTSDFIPVSPAQAAFHCATGFNLQLIPVQSGNLQVRP